MGRVARNHRKAGGAIEVAEKTIEERVHVLEDEVHEVLTNHIPHITEDIQEIKSWIRGIAIGGLAAVLGLILKGILG